MIARFPKPSKERPGAWLLCEEGYAVGKRFPVDEVEFWIGALENNQLRIADDPTLSGNHACLVFDHDVLGIYDHQSTNGTRVNGVLVGETRHLLRPGDRVRVGRSTFVIEPAEEGAGQ
jgi:pSer/pThr/pTyr-binding forkhead associated (FHA) protein